MRSTMAVVALAVTVLGALGQAAENPLDQAEAQLRQQLVGRSVVAMLDMPAHKDGVDLHVDREPAIDPEELQERLRKHGISVRALGEPVEITAIRRKGKHIEVHLNGGGWSGRVPTVPWTVDPTPEEVGLGRPAQPREREAIRRRQAELQEERRRRDSRAYEEYVREREEYERQRVAAGSRFNVRYPHRLTTRELSVESLTAVLQAYLVLDVRK